jgi:predicted PurR-regulated permease PerM
VLVALVSNGLTGAIIILVVIVAVQQLEGNVLSPILQSRSSELHPGVVLLAIALGSTLFGIIGAFLAVPVTSTAAAIFRYLNELVAARSVEEAERGEDLPRAGEEHPAAPPAEQDPATRRVRRLGGARRAGQDPA